jgi:hypothetical protein
VVGDLPFKDKTGTTPTGEQGRGERNDVEGGQSVFHANGAMKMGW